MAQMIGWVHDAPRFQADMADLTLRNVINTAIHEWESRGPYVMWGLYFTAMGEDIDDYSEEEEVFDQAEVEAQEAEPQTEIENRR